MCLLQRNWSKGDKKVMQDKTLEEVYKRIKKFTMNLNKSVENISLQMLQEEVKEWSTKNFPDAKPYQPLLGAAEEIGELCHAHLKMEQNIRTNQNHKDDAEDAIADCIIYLADYAWRNGYDLQNAINKVWPKVKQRDWTKNKVDGGKTDANS